MMRFLIFQNSLEFVPPFLEISSANFLIFFLFRGFPALLLVFFGHYNTVLVFLLCLSSVCMPLQSPFCCFLG